MFFKVLLSYEFLGPPLWACSFYCKILRTAAADKLFAISPMHFPPSEDVPRLHCSLLPVSRPLLKISSRDKKMYMYVRAASDLSKAACAIFFNILCFCNSNSSSCFTISLSLQKAQKSFALNVSPQIINNLVLLPKDYFTIYHNLLLWFRLPVEMNGTRLKTLTWFFQVKNSPQMNYILLSLLTFKSYLPLE